MAILSPEQKYQLVQQTINNIPHVAIEGICIEKIEGEKISLRMPYRDDLIGNPETGAIHSGVLTMLLDSALGIATLCSDKFSPTITPTLDLRIDHLGIVPAGKDILACAWPYKVTQKVVFIEGFAYWDSEDKPIARATGSFVRLKEIQLPWSSAGDAS